MKVGKFRDRLTGFGLAVILTLIGLTAPACAQEQPAPGDQKQLSEPVYRVNNDKPSEQTASLEARPPIRAEQVAAQEHPIMPALRIASKGLAAIDANIQDYSCVLVKRERIKGKLGDREYIFTKVRHNPFSVYMFFLGPNGVKGRECIFSKEQNEGKLIVRDAGFNRKLGVFKLAPSGMLAMRGQKYPITEVGLRNLTARLIEVAEADSQFGECEVTFRENAKINGRVCTLLQVTHPVPRKNFRFHLAQVFIDDELQIPVRYAAYQWPKRTGGEPVLDEEYTYLNLKLNNGFTDEDFNEWNPNYKFHK